MKSVLISIKPKWCELIASGNKTIEIRKTKPKLDTPFKCYIYCTEFKAQDYTSILLLSRILYGQYRPWSKKVIGEFACDKIIMVDCDSVGAFDKDAHEYIENETCLTREEFCHYTSFRCAFGWHISDLKIYDEPKKLTEFGKNKPPQSWCYVEDYQQGGVTTYAN